MVKHTQSILRQIADELLSVFDHFVGLVLKGLNVFANTEWKIHKTLEKWIFLFKSFFTALNTYGGNFLSALK